MSAFNKWILLLRAKGCSAC